MVHTPGPWLTGQENQPQPLYRGIIAILEHSPEKRVFVWQNATMVIDHEANARLIAASPMILAELQNLSAAVSLMDPIPYAKDLATAKDAIAKATEGGS